MQDKLQKILKIKIDAINRNIDNLNYLNGELEKNERDLNYIEEKINLFNGDELLNFDQISKEDFEKILLMIDSSITDIFKDKTCNYDGIIYIIEGIRKSISLQLTEEQTKAISSFVYGMKDKVVNLKEVISNLEESKNRLPETNLDNLSNQLDNYKNITSKLDDNLYLVEIDELEEALNFANVSIEEKADMFEYILKYNAAIFETTKSETIEKNEESVIPSFDLPNFDYEPLDLNYDEFNNKDAVKEEIDSIKTNLDELETNLDNNEEEFKPNLDDIKFNLDKLLEKEHENDVEKEEQKEFGETNDDIEKQSDQIINIPNLDAPNLNIELPHEEKASLDIDQDDNYNELETATNSNELNTVELEDIIKKIDAKLKEMETSDEQKELKETSEVSVDEINPTVEQPNNFQEEPKFENNKQELLEIFQKYAISELDVINSNTDDVDKMLAILNDNKLIDLVRNNRLVLTSILSNGTSDRLNEIISLANEYLLVKHDELSYVLEITLETMAILFANKEVLESFKKNLEFFKEKNINIINLFDNYRELLIMNHDLVKENYQMIEKYGFNVNNENVKYFLYNKNVLKNIDSYIEAIGYEKGFLGRDDYFDGVEYIKKNPYKLNNMSRELLLKLRYASENNTKIYGNKPGILSGEIANSKVDIINLSSDYINSYFNGEYSFMDRSEYSSLKEEIESLKDFDMTLDGNLNKLDSNYKVNELKYKIGNIVLSRVKTIRIYNFLKNKNMSLKNALLIALTYNTVMKNTEYEEIVKVVENILEGGN